MSENGIKEPDRDTLKDMIVVNKFGEPDIGKSFLLPEQEATRITNKNSRKQRAIVFRRSLIKKTTRKKFDEGKSAHAYIL